MDLQAIYGNALFDETILTYSDLSYTQLVPLITITESGSYSQIVSCDLTNSDLSNVILHYTEFAICNLEGVDLSITDFRSDNKFPGSSLRNTILSDELFNTDLTAKNTFIDSMPFSLTGSDLSGVNFQNKNFRDVQFTHLVLDTLVGVDLENVRTFYELSVNLSDTNFSGENLSGLKLQFVKFNSANLSGSNLSSSDLRFSDFSGANLQGANLQGANLQGANLQGAILDNAVLSNANLKCKNHPVCFND